MAAEAAAGGPPSWRKRAVRIDDELVESILLAAEHIPALGKQRGLARQINWVLRAYEKDLLRMAADCKALSEGRDVDGVDAQELARRLGLKE